MMERSMSSRRTQVGSYMSHWAGQHDHTRPGGIEVNPGSTRLRIGKGM